MFPPPSAISNFVATLNETSEKVIPHCGKLSRTLSGKGEVRVLCGVLGSLILARNRRASEHQILLYYTDLQEKAKTRLRESRLLVPSGRMSEFMQPPLAFSCISAHY